MLLMIVRSSLVALALLRFENDEEELVSHVIFLLLLLSSFAFDHLFLPIYDCLYVLSTSSPSFFSLFFVQLLW